jgi:hypothetical protein
MDFLEQMQALAGKVAKVRSAIQTEEATKLALVMPFISALGYDVSNPSEVIPEFTADVGTKKGEKVDYMIMHEGAPILLLECKKLGSPLEDAAASQLYRYYSVSKVRFGVLTDGAIYRFFTDTEAANKMDSKPFLEVDISNPQHPLLGELKRFSKENFNLDDIVEAAKELKYLGGVKTVLIAQMNDPAEDFVRFLATQVYDGLMRQKTLELFQGIVKRAFKEFINEQIQDRLRAALNQADPNAGSASVSGVPDDMQTAATKAADWLPEEQEAFQIVRAILRQSILPKRMALRVGKTYSSILLDDSNRKPLCRLYLHGGKKSIGLFDDHRVEKPKVQISDLDDIFTHGNELIETGRLYETGQMKGKEPSEEAENGTS